MPLLIVIPVRNEERRLGPGLAWLAESLQANGCRDALIVVSDNGSTDWTRAAAIEAAAKNPYRVVYHQACDHGDKGVAICSAWESAPEGYDVFAYCDADMATDPEALVRGYRLIAEGKADLVVGSRWHRDSRVIGRSWRRTFISAMLSCFWRMLPGARLTDPGCGLKLGGFRPSRAGRRQARRDPGPLDRRRRRSHPPRQGRRRLRAGVGEIGWEESRTE